MPTAYFDTNVNIIGILQPDSNSRLILREIKKGKIKIVLSDYLIDEVMTWFKINKDKDFASMVRLYMMSLPASEMINDFQWSIFIDDWKDRKILLLILMIFLIFAHILPVKRNIL